MQIFVYVNLTEEVAEQDWWRLGLQRPRLFLEIIKYVHFEHGGWQSTTSQLQ